MVTRLSRVVFVVLVAATFSAFFVAQELKSRPPVVELRQVTQYFSPNGDGRRDINRISVVVRQPDEVTIGIVDQDGDRVRRLVDNVEALPYRPVRAEWDGRDDAGNRVPDGIYRVRVGLRDQNRSVVVQRAIRLDTTPPDPFVRVDADHSIIGPRGRRVPLLVRGAGSRRAPRLVVWRTDVEPARRVAELTGRASSARAEWDGQIDGEAAPPGVYFIEAIAEDRAGNVGSSAPGLPELPDEVRGRPGVTVRALAAQPPLEPQQAGEPATFLIDSRRRPYRWDIRRLGRSRPARSGAADEGEPRLRRLAPDGPSGVYLLELRSGRYSTRVPFLVQSSEQAPLLVVLPAITWLGRDRVDDDGDGLPNTLERRVPVRWPRPFSGDEGLPAGFADRQAPLLVALDRGGIPYDVTTDLALSQGAGPRIGDYEGVLLAGSLRWIPPPLGVRLRDYVNEGGRVASIGVESMRRGVTLAATRLVRPTEPSPTDALGTRLLDVRRIGRGDDPLLEPVEERPGARLFEGSDGVLSGFTLVEEALPPDGDDERLLAALAPAVTDDDVDSGPGEAGVPGADPPAGEAVEGPLPVLAAKRVGRGLVIRVGLPQWGERVVDDREVAQINRNIADLLRGVQPRVRTARR